MPDDRPFQPSRYGSAVASLLSIPRLPAVGPGQADASHTAALRSLTNADLASGHPIRDPVMLDCCRSGLWLWFDFLHESHSLSQEIETTTGSYWHGIMHRREPDYGNAKYWFRRIGDHPILEHVGPACARALSELEQHGVCQLDHTTRWLIAGDRWDPFRFVDLCQSVSRSGGVGGAGVRACQEAARIEWEVLFDYCYEQAVDLTH